MTHVLLATTGYTLTLFFETSDGSEPEDGALAPEIEIHDNDSNKIGIGAFGSVDRCRNERLWKAEFTVPMKMDTDQL